MHVYSGFCLLVSSVVVSNLTVEKVLQCPRGEGFSLPLPIHRLKGVCLFCLCILKARLVGLCPRVPDLAQGVSHTRQSQTPLVLQPEVTELRLPTFFSPFPLNFRAQIPVILKYSRIGPSRAPLMSYIYHRVSLPGPWILY